MRTLQEVAVDGAFFDIDETLIRGASSYHLFRELYRRGFFHFSDLVYGLQQYFLYLVCGENRERIDEITRRGLSSIAGHSVAEMINIGDSMSEWMYHERLFHETAHLVQSHLHHGAEVWLLSATPQEITDLLATRLHATGSRGTRIARKEGLYMPALEGKLLHGEEKARHARLIAHERGLRLSHCYAYSDSYSDVPLLELVGHPVAVNPDSKLRAYARTKGWPLYDFRRSVRLWHAQPVRCSAYVAGGLWVLRLLAHRLTHTS